LNPTPTVNGCVPPVGEVRLNVVTVDPDGVGLTTTCVNVADTLCAALIITVQLPVPLHAPVQPEKV
jgi:hypothetical protein